MSHIRRETRILTDRHSLSSGVLKRDPCTETPQYRQGYWRIHLAEIHLCLCWLCNRLPRIRRGILTLIELYFSSVFSNDVNLFIILPFILLPMLYQFYYLIVHNINKSCHCEEPFTSFSVNSATKQSHKKIASLTNTLCTI